MDGGDPYVAYAAEVLASADTVTVLRTKSPPGGKRPLATKMFRRKPGTVTKTDYDKAKRFAIALDIVEGIHELGALLRRLEGDPYALIVRGEPLPGIDW